VQMHPQLLTSCITHAVDPPANSSQRCGGCAHAPQLQLWQVLKPWGWTDWGLKRAVCWLQATIQLWGLLASGDAGHPGLDAQHILQALQAVPVHVHKTVSSPSDIINL
jgi:hypothetical protein